MFGALFSSQQYQSSTADLLRELRKPLWETTTTTITKYRRAMVDVTYKRKSNTSVVRPQYHSRGAAAFDLGPIENLNVGPGEIVRADTGIVMKSPPEHVLFLTSRSSTPARHGVQILNGIIDEDYCGDDDWLAMTVWNFTQERVFIPAGTRIAQGLFMPVTHARFNRVDVMGEPSRGGYGSTG